MKNKKKSAFIFANIMILLVGIAMGSVQQNVNVKIWEEPLVLPTYPVGNSEVLPIYYKGNAYQGATRSVYPYAFMDKLIDVKEKKVYKALYLENKYIKLCVLPEIGGRLFYAMDKTNGYDLFYRQSVVKPCLIGMIGAWIAGGIEWNFPHHHRVSTFMPVDYTLQANADGSKTIWIGELEFRHRMKWTLGLTLYPDKSYIEISVKLFNRTPFVHSMLFWSNVAVHANDEYQVIFPPRTEYATYHAKREFTQWPISHQIYRGIDFTKGVDISRYKNYKSGTSFFAWNYKDDFIAGYDHSKEAGVVHVANHHIAPGKKLWTWGKDIRGKNWQKVYTDTDGPYVEIMAGAYSDNQPDYSWFQPYEVRTFKEYWYPLREIKDVKQANVDAAVTLDILSNNKIWIAFNTTEKHNRAKVILWKKDKIIFEDTINISPDSPYAREIELQSGIDKSEMKVFLFSHDERELISYQQVQKSEISMPKTVKPPLPPGEIKSIEELYLMGLRLEQFYNPSLDPESYYKEALKRDPDYTCANIALGVLYCRKGRFAEAEKKLDQALKRLTNRYTHPKSGEAFYYLGIALRGQAKFDKAFDTFYKATWCQDFKAASFYALAELSCLKGNYSEALKLVDCSLSVNFMSKKANGLKTVLLRRLGRFDKAKGTALAMQDFDPLDFWADYELYLIEKETGLKNKKEKRVQGLSVKMRNVAQSYLELAIDYGNCGFWCEAIDVLSIFINSGCKESSFPMLYYYKGYYLDKKGFKKEARKAFNLAEKMPQDYCFPFRLESIDVLRSAIEQNPQDAKALYYLGNLLFNIQPKNKKVLQLWEKSAKLDASFFIVHRNVGMFYKRIEKDYPKAIRSYKRAIACNNKVARLFLELDKIYEATGVSIEKRLALFEENHNTICQKDGTIVREIVLLTLMGYYNKAIHLLKTHQFHVWEGGGELRKVYENLYLLKGIDYLQEKKHLKALEYFKNAMDYPVNLQVWSVNKGIEPKVDYFIGLTYNALRDSGKAKKYFEKSISYKRSLSELSYYQGLSFQKLNFNNKADYIFEQLINLGKDRLKAEPSINFFAKFGSQQLVSVKKAQAHYLLGLGYLGNKKKDRAKAEFQQAFRLDVNHLWAKIQLTNLNSNLEE